ncbi:MAG: hypothetical protein AAF770_00975 [Bacteroidota bacterium]
MKINIILHAILVVISITTLKNSLFRIKLSSQRNFLVVRRGFSLTDGLTSILLALLHIAYVQGYMPLTAILVFSIFLMISTSLVGNYLIHNNYATQLKKLVFVEKPMSVSHAGTSWCHLFWNPFSWIGKNKIDYGNKPVAVAQFICFFYMIPSFTTQATDKVYFYQVLAVVRLIGVTLCTALLLKNQWAKSMKHHYTLLYLYTLLYCLPFANMLVFLQDPNDYMTTLFLVLHLILLAFLVDKSTFLSLSITGILLAFLSYRLLEGQYLPNTSLENWIFVSLGGIFALVAGSMFAKNKE